MTVSTVLPLVGVIVATALSVVSAAQGIKSRAVAEAAQGVAEAAEARAEQNAAQVVELQRLLPVVM